METFKGQVCEHRNKQHAEQSFTATERRDRTSWGLCQAVVTSIVEEKLE